MSKSIMHDKQEGTCYLCRLLHQDYARRTNLEEHHVMNGNPNRRISEKYGLKVYLCRQHHREGREAVHGNKKIMDLLQRRAQEAFEARNPQLSFQTIFGKNCILDKGEDSGAWQQASAGEGFRFIEGLSGLEKKAFWEIEWIYHEGSACKP